MRISSQMLTAACAVATFCVSTCSSLIAADSPDVIRRAAWSFDRSKIKWYDPAKTEDKKKQGIMNEMCGWAEYDIEIPADGWFELLEKEGVPGWPRDTFVDGKMILNFVIAENSDIEAKVRQGEQGKWYKECNLWLTKGKHTLRLRRLGFPGILPSAFELVPSKGRPDCSVMAEQDGADVIRAGERYKLKVTGGGTGAKARYEIFLKNLLLPEEPLQAAGEVEFSASDEPRTKTVKIDCAKEGVFQVMAKVDGKLLRPSEFRGGQFVVVDTKNAGFPKEMRKTLIHEIDCVTQKDMGKEIKAGEKFWDVTEPTRIAKSAAGEYREGGDNTDTKLPSPPSLASHLKYNSGFAYDIDVPKKQELYLLEVDYPDDDRRTVNVFVAEPETDMSCQLYGGYETGDCFELSNKMQTEKVLFWARGTKVRAAILSKNPGMRAAAAKIRVYKIEDGLVGGPAQRPDGRLMIHWMEEPTRWLQHAVPPKELPPIAKDFLAIERYLRLCQYSGFNAVSPTEAIYQGTTYNSKELEGWFIQPYDAPRIVAFMCEKFGMKYIPEIHLSGQAWFHTEVVDKLDPKTEDLYIWSRLGTSSMGGGGSWFCSTWNPLHPAIQEKYIKIIGELSDKLADTPAFSGVSLRLMSWVWQGWNGLPSLNWGYGDWDIAQFQKDSGIKVPGEAGSPDRFEKRFDFLTSEKMLPTWIAWRNGRMLDYYRQIRDRIRKANPEAVLYLPYYGDAAQGMDLTFGSYFGTEKGALLEVGLDLAKLANEPGISVYPSGMYGRRGHGDLVADADVSDSTASPEKFALGFGRERAFGFGNAYFEDQKQVHTSAFGLPELKGTRADSGNNGAAEGAGRNTLEKLACAVAEQDSGALRQGGMGYTFGRPDEYREWLAEFEQLPKEPFTAFEAARDPVAVWFKKCDDGFFFYAVNRESYEIPVAIQLKDCGKMISLGSGTEAVAPEGKLSMTLKPFQIRAFKAKRGATIISVESVVPKERIALVRNRIAFCQELADEISIGSRKNDVSEKDRKAFLEAVNSAWDAAEQHHWWRARTVLSSTPVIKVFNLLAQWPDGQLHRRLGIGALKTENRGGTDISAAQILTADDLEKALKDASNVKKVDSTTYNPEWLFTKVLRAENGVFEANIPVTVDGRYRLSIGHCSDKPCSMMVSLGTVNMPVNALCKIPGMPEKTIFPVVELKAGTTLLSVKGQSPFGIYGVTLQPEYRPLPSPNWMTVGPFPTKWYSGAKGELVKEAMGRTDVPAGQVDLKSEFNADGRKLKWEYNSEIRGGIPHMNENAGLSYLYRAKVQDRGVCHAVTFINSPDERDAEILIGCDWWANAWLNGEQLKTNRKPELVADDGCQFNGWRPLPSKVHLKKGRNILMVKSHGGTVANWFTCYISDPGDLVIGKDAK